MSSKIAKYPGTEVTPEELESGRFLLTSYETVTRYSWTSGVAISRFLDGLKEGEVWARRCNSCGRTIVPPRMYCEECFRPTDDWVRVKDRGTVSTFSISYVNADASRRKTPILVTVVWLDGASPENGILHLLGEVKPKDVRVGMKVKAVWKPKSQREGAITDIRYFKPVV
ncbi:MAG TPA: Zn-ribbon domain-containing OB-fold protein [Nitrososphaerales archaeon]|nr:Zn-ribbon domain-containing OB-fold protein [Nitrososphaerales archaeon]